MKFCKTFTEFEQASYDWMAKNGILFMRLSMGLIFFWFGFQKFFKGVSSAETLATRTIEVVSFGLVTDTIAMPLLATWEVLIGLGFLTGYFIRITSLLLFLQMIGTFVPLFAFPKETFFITPIVPTLAGQYIIKNLVVIGAGMVILAYYQGRVLRKGSEKTQ